MHASVNHTLPTPLMEVSEASPFKSQLSSWISEVVIYFNRRRRYVFFQCGVRIILTSAAHRTFSENVLVAIHPRNTFLSPWQMLIFPRVQIPTKVLAASPGQAAASWIAASAGVSCPQAQCTSRPRSCYLWKITVPWLIYASTRGWTASSKPAARAEIVRVKSALYCSYTSSTKKHIVSLLSPFWIQPGGY